MPVFQWSDQYSIGVPLIDADHQLLVALLTQLSEACEEGQSREVIGSILNVLIEYTIHHFRREEQMMSRGGYPELAEHQDDHRRLVAEAERFQAEWIAGRHDAVEDLSDFLSAWLQGHILAVDIRYKPWVEEVECTSDELAGIFAPDESDGQYKGR